MRAAVCRQLGEPGALSVEAVDRPRPGPGEALVRIHAAGVNLPDVLIMAGRYQVAVAPPFVLGAEFAGVVAEVGSGVGRVRVGDRVAGMVTGNTAASGAFAEFAAVPESALTPVPETVDLAVAAATWVCHLTAYHALRSVAELRAGERLVVLGAAGGVGLAAVEVGALLGATVVAAASSPEKLAVCRDQGATHLIDYEREPLRDAIRAACGGADVVLDPVGGRWAEPALRTLGWGGRFVTIGYASGEIPKIPLNLVLLKGMTILGFGNAGLELNEPELAARDRAELGDLLADGKLAPRIGARYPLDEAAAALALVANRQAIGKIVLDIAP
ncbi:Zn-dependent oxidoreductase, NADPH:quinone reductase [Frankia canadensis]|uniref:Zn-dependent oxidoreductase, NADPH:quinone reductase n=1 Tax=Frankia canadensis TaxID=1836972 RepID=A0A2I2KMF5_9ACTN|nr:NADPH:quinone oxidoreductase family protein [Frankia canadensis]SNQ46857.1 Zn-dependent oxidoreductase, NADPH:quinone reductase [Frankia canadensis]SOU54147.1 Zn-dependent oxidoreductase, NADPH:quinone reductase [Frankia canadensis]